MKNYNIHNFNKIIVKKATILSNINLSLHLLYIKTYYN